MEPGARRRRPLPRSCQREGLNRNRMAAEGKQKMFVNEDLVRRPQRAFSLLTSCSGFESERDDTISNSAVTYMRWNAESIFEQFTAHIIQEQMEKCSGYITPDNCLVSLTNYLL